MELAPIGSDLGSFSWLLYKHDSLSQLLYKGAEFYSEEGGKEPGSDPIGAGSVQLCLSSFDCYLLQRS